MTITKIYFKTVSNALQASGEYTVEWILLFILNIVHFRKPICIGFL